MEKNKILKLDFNKLAFELFENLLESDQNFSPGKYFELVGPKGTGKTALLNYFQRESKKKNKNSLLIKGLNEEIEDSFNVEIQYDFIVIDNVESWEQVIKFSELFSNSKIIYSLKSIEAIDTNSLVIRANITSPSLEEFSQIIKFKFSESGINLKESTCNILGYLTEKSEKGFHTINTVLKKSKVGFYDDDVLYEFEKSLNRFGVNRLRNHFDC